MKTHASHIHVLKRLKRAKGHLEKVIAMIEAEKPCLDAAQQLHAVECAIKNAKQIYIRDHIDHCLDDTIIHNSKNKKKHFSEFKEITKYL